MDQEAIDRLQALYFKAKLATVDARKLEEATNRIHQRRADQSAEGPSRRAQEGTEQGKSHASDYLSEVYYRGQLL